MNLIKEKLLSDKKISEKSLIPWQSVILTWLTKNIQFYSEKNYVISPFEALQKRFLMFLLIKYPEMLPFYLNGIVVKRH